MKNIYKLFLGVSVISLLTTACNESEDVITADAKEGAFLSIAGSSGSLAGSPEGGVDLADAEITFQEALLTYTASVVAGADQVSELVVVKTFGDQKVEVARTSESTILVEYATVAEYIAGFEGVTATDLRVGNVIGFQTEIIMKDGRTLVNAGAAFNIGVSCLSDLTGTYSVTNSGCNNANFPFTVTVTKNADGSYHLTSADGGFLHRCTANSTLVNAGNIIEQCGEILPTGDLDFGSANSTYDIGEIGGGTWDAATGTITMEHSQSFTGNWPSEWTSTYVRQ